MQRATTRLRTLVKRGKFLELPSAYDPITARLAESPGFKTIYNGGSVTGGSSCIGPEDDYRIERRLKRNTRFHAMAGKMRPRAPQLAFAQLGVGDYVLQNQDAHLSAHRRFITSLAHAKIGLIRASRSSASSRTLPW